MPRSADPRTVGSRPRHDRLAGRSRAPAPRRHRARARIGAVRRRPAGSISGPPADPSPHSASIRCSADTIPLAPRTRCASTIRCLGPPRLTGPFSPRASNDPSSPKRIGRPYSRRPVPGIPPLDNARFDHEASLPDRPFKPVSPVGARAWPEPLKANRRRPGRLPESATAHRALGPRRSGNAARESQRWEEAPPEYVKEVGRQTRRGSAAATEKEGVDMRHHRARTRNAIGILAHMRKLGRGAALLVGLVVLAVGATALATPIVGVQGTNLGVATFESIRPRRSRPSGRPASTPRVRPTSTSWRTGSHREGRSAGTRIPAPASSSSRAAS